MVSTADSMKAVVCNALGSVELTEVPKPRIGHPRDVLVRVTATSICGSDLHMIEHKEMIGSPLGHEFVGVVEEVGSGIEGLQPGQRVVGPAAVWCGNCAECRRGHTSHCLRGGIFGCGPEFGSLGGAQSQWIDVPWADRTLSLIPDTVTDAQALAVGDALSTGWSGVRQSVDHPSAVLLVLGCGPIGLSAILTATLHGVRQVVAVDLNPIRRRTALDFGASAAFASVAEALAPLAELTGGRGPDAVVDAAGTPATITGALEAVGIGGKIAVLGLSPQPVEVNFLSLLYKNATTWAGLGDLTRMDTLISAIDTGLLDPSGLFTETIDFSEIETAYAAASTGSSEVVKYLVKVS